MCAQITSDEEGKRVVNATGDVIGVVESVQAGTPYVKPDPGVTDTIMATMGWGDADEETYALDERDVEAITDDEVQIRRR